jgi:hypothetical protein
MDTVRSSGPGESVNRGEPRERSYLRAAVGEILSSRKNGPGFA